MEHRDGGNGMVAFATQRATICNYRLIDSASLIFTIPVIAGEERDFNNFLPLGFSWPCRMRRIVRQKQVLTIADKMVANGMLAAGCSFKFGVTGVYWPTAAYWDL